MGKISSSLNLVDTPAGTHLVWHLDETKDFHTQTANDSVRQVHIHTQQARLGDSPRDRPGTRVRLGPLVMHTPAPSNRHTIPLAR